MTDRTAVIEDLYSVFAAGDMGRLSTLLEDIDWVEAPGMPYAGRYRGFAEVATNVFGPIGGDVKGFTVVPDEIIPAGHDRVLATGRYRGTGIAGPLDAPFAHLWTVRDGRIIQLVQHADTHLFRQAVGA